MAELIVTINSSFQIVDYEFSSDQKDHYLFFTEKVGVFVDGYIYSFGYDNQPLNNSCGELFAQFLLKILRSGLFSKLNTIKGHYNILVCDSIRNQLYVISDRYGMRPLYWSRIESNIVFSKNVKSISRLVGFNKNINYSAIKDFIKFDWVTNDATFFKNISMVGSGKIINFSKGKMTNTHYWSWPKKYILNDDTVEKNAESVNFLFSEAIEHTSFDIKSPAVTLSGGLDSRIVAGSLFSKKSKVVLYHCANNYFETEGARGIAKNLGQGLVETQPLKLYDEQFSLNSIILGDGCTSINQFWLLRLFQLIKQDGLTDCVFDGFFLDMLLNPPDFMSYHYGIDGRITGKNSKREIANVIYGLPEGYIEKYFSGSLLGDITESALLNIDKYFSGVDVDDSVYFSRILYLMTRGKRFAVMMPNIDQHFCRIRFPGLDYELVDFCLSLPVDQFKLPRVYLSIFKNYFQELNQAVWAKTGLPLYLGDKGQKRYRPLLHELNVLTRRLSRGRCDFLTPAHDYNKMFRKNKAFHDRVLGYFGKKYCIEHGIIDQKGFSLLVENIRNGRNDFALIERLLAIESFFAFFLYS